MHPSVICHENGQPKKNVSRSDDGELVTYLYDLVRNRPKFAHHELQVIGTMVIMRPVRYGVTVYFTAGAKMTRLLRFVCLLPSSRRRRISPPDSMK